MHKTAVLLINVGTPDAPETGAVRRYLREFLNDPRVITLPGLWRKLLVNGIIVPFRGPRSAKLYQKLWTPQGSPLLTHAMELKNKLQEKLGEEYTVYFAMRYGDPALKKVLKIITHQGHQRLIVLPLYPQYASSTTGSAMELVFGQLAAQNTIPGLLYPGAFYQHPDFIGCFARRILATSPEKYDHILFSYHGLPLNQVKAAHPGDDCSRWGCTHEVNEQNAFCYHATTYATSRLIAAQAGIAPERYTVCYQSRFARNWLSPFTDEVLKDLARQGKKKVLVVSPSFVADCLETILELGQEYREIFLHQGGEVYDWLPSLNADDDWVDTLGKMIKSCLIARTTTK